MHDDEPILFTFTEEMAEALIERAKREGRYIPLPITSGLNPLVRQKAIEIYDLTLDEREPNFKTVRYSQDA